MAFWKSRQFFARPELERREICGGAGLLSHHANRDGAPARGVARDDGAVVRELEPNEARALALHLDRVDDRRHRLPRAVVEVAARGGNGSAGLYPLDVDVLLVHAHDRQAERDALVMADRHAGTRGLARADHVPARTDEMRDVPNRRMRDRAVWIVREDRFAGARLLPADDPVVRTLDALKRDVLIRTANAAERCVVETGEVEAGYGVERTRRLRRQRGLRFLRPDRRHEPRAKNFGRRVRHAREGRHARERHVDRPRLRREAHQRELDRQAGPSSRDVRVDAGDERAHDLPRIRAIRRPLGVSWTRGSERVAPSDRDRRHGRPRTSARRPSA